MNSIRYSVCIIFALLTLADAARAASIPDDPVSAIEPAIELNTYTGGTMGWLDVNTLIVTAIADREKQSSSRKVMLVDIRTGKADEKFSQGEVTCVSATKSIVGIQSGERFKSPPSFFKWNAKTRELEPASELKGENWDFSVCQKVLPGKDMQNTFVLQDKDGLLVNEMAPDGKVWRMSLVKDGKVIANPDIKPSDLSVRPEYQPHNDEYLLAYGRFVTGGAIQKDGLMLNELPILTMTPTGSIKRGDSVRSIFESNGTPDNGIARPYAKGILIWSDSRPKQGGGVYLRSNGQTKRVWCINPGNTFDRTCRLETAPSISPNGCHAAFFSKSSDNINAEMISAPTLKILPLCR